MFFKNNLPVVDREGLSASIPPIAIPFFRRIFVRMRLTWSDSSGIAMALSKAYPEQDRLGLSLAALKNMIEALPGFGRDGDKAADAPSQDHLRHILWTWMRIADGMRVADGG